MDKFKHGERVLLKDGKSGRIIRGAAKQDDFLGGGWKCLVSIDGGGILPVAVDDIIHHEPANFVKPVGAKDGEV